MKSAWILGIGCAVLLHAGVLTFGGLVVGHGKKDHGTLQQVELLADDAKPEEKKPEEQQPPKEELKQESEPPPDAAEILKSLDQPPENSPPALEAASLGALEQALNGGGGSGDFNDTLSFASGGRIGGLGKAGALDDKMEQAFSLSEIDQKPRVVFQAGALFPAEMRGKKQEGCVTVTFLVDATGKVARPRVAKSSHPAFEKPALEAVKQWRFEPAVKGGQRVGCKMRVDVRFPPG
jgi:protein TonB